jgi:hypothetical protein
MVLVLGSVAAGCGDGQPAPQAQGEVAGPVTKPRVAAFARAVNLKPSDLPGAAVMPTREDSAGEDLGAPFASCTGSSIEPPKVAAFVTPTFLFAERDEWAGFVSQVGAAPTPYEAKAMVSLLRSPQGFSCLQQLLPRAFEEESKDDHEIRDVSVSRLTTPLPPTHDAYGIRIDMLQIEGGREHRLFADVISFVSGPNEIVLEVFGAPTPVNQQVEAGLVATLYFRALSAGF